MKAEDIMSLIIMTYNVLDEIKVYSAAVLGIMRTAWMIYRKVKIYGLKAFSSREQYRAELDTFKTSLEEVEQRIGIKKRN